MRVSNASIYVLACALAFFLYCTVKGADVCGSDKSAENQVIFNESFAEHRIKLFGMDKAPRMTCAWQITASQGYRVVLHLGHYNQKVMESLKIVVFDGNSSSDVLLWNSSETFPWFAYLFSSGKHMRVVLKTGNHSASSLLPYKASVSAELDCNRVFNLNASSTVGKFKSTHFPILYPPNMSCIWKIQAPPGKFVRLQSIRLYVENRNIQIYDGEESKKNLLNKYKWQLEPYVIFSITQALLIKFKSGPTPWRRDFDGYEIDYTAVGPGCFVNNGNTSVGFNASFGSISTPGFPSDVPLQAITCVWSLKAPVGHVIKLDLDTINLNSRISFCTELNIEYLSIYELKRFDLLYLCKNYTSRTLISSGRIMQVMFTKPAYKVRKSVGVIAKFAAIPLVTTGSCAANQPGTINLKGEAATFHSLNYPKNHPGNMTCTWNITVTSGQVIELRIDTNLSSDCSKEYIRIHDGPTKSSPVITKLCQVPYERKVYSSSNHLFVEFVGKIPSQGFVATYIARKAKPKPYACSSPEYQFNEKQGMLASRGFPLSYPNNVKCDWYIKVPPQYIVNFTLLFFDLQPDPSCSKDYLLLLEVGEGFIDGKEMAKICGKNITQASYQSTSRQMIIKFRSDAIGMYPGFEAKFEAVDKPPESTNKVSRKVSTVTIVLIVIFSVLGVIGLTILIVWIVKYRYHCCADRSHSNFDMVKMADTDDVKT